MPYMLGVLPRTNNILPVTHLLDNCLSMFRCPSTHFSLFRLTRHTCRQNYEHRVEVLNLSCRQKTIMRLKFNLAGWGKRHLRYLQAVTCTGRQVIKMPIQSRREFRSANKICSVEWETIQDLHTYDAGLRGFIAQALDALVIWKWEMNFVLELRNK